MGSERICTKTLVANPFNSCKGGASLDWTKTEFRGFRDQVNSLKSLLCLLNHWRTMFACDSKHYPATAIKDYPATAINTVAMKWCSLCVTIFKSDHRCQSNIHINARTQELSAEHCPEHHTASAGLPVSYSGISLVPDPSPVRDVNNVKENVIH